MFSLMGILTIIEIVLGLGLVIFVHELGHFLVAKFYKVRVETFSLGFGPKIFGFKRGDTEYKVCWLPLGGYVKMAGESVTENDPDDPAHFQNKPVGQRAAIFVAGVVMNLLFGLGVSILAFQIGVRFEEPRIGEVAKGSAAWEGGIQEGDKVVSIDGKEVTSFLDIAMLVAFADSEEGLLFEVEREVDGEVQTKELRIHPQYHEERGFQTIGVGSALTTEITVRAGSAASEAGLEDGDVLVSIEGVPIDTAADLRDVLNEEPAGDELKVIVRRDGEEKTFSLAPELTTRYMIGIVNGGRKVERVARGSRAEESGLRAGDELLRAGEERHASFAALDQAFRAEVRKGEETRRVLVFARTGPDGESEEIELPPLGPEEGLALLAGILWDQTGVHVGATLAGYPAAEHLLPGDRITHVDGEEMERWGDFQTVVREKKGEPMELRWERDAQTMTASLQAKETRQIAEDEDTGIGLRTIMSEPVREDLVTSCRLGWRHSIDNFKYVLLTLVGILTRKVSASNLGGPITIAQASWQFSQFGFGRFIYFLGLLSINLAIINLLPIPILDGAHLVLCAIEKVKGKPLSQNLQVKINYVGLFLILALMVFVFYNDIHRLVRVYM
ncbi:MAG: RIP metalloprotease RseP [Planctomycetes bacterium]|nr:RIP metalloprotease RseP [Planctomycetota bacterium]